MYIRSYFFLSPSIWRSSDTTCTTYSYWMSKTVRNVPEEPVISKGDEYVPISMARKTIAAILIYPLHWNMKVTVCIFEDLSIPRKKLEPSSSFYTLGLLFFEYRCWLSNTFWQLFYERFLWSETLLTASYFMMPVLSPVIRWPWNSVLLNVSSILDVSRGRWKQRNLCVVFAENNLGSWRPSDPIVIWVPVWWSSALKPFSFCGHVPSAPRVVLPWNEKLPKRIHKNCEMTHNKLFTRTRFDRDSIWKCYKVAKISLIELDDYRCGTELRTVGREQKKTDSRTLRHKCNIIW